MMMNKYRDCIQTIDQEMADQILSILMVPRCKEENSDLFYTLDRMGHDQANLVLCLLRINSNQALYHVEELIGHPITKCPTVYKWKSVPLYDPCRSEDLRRVLYVVPEPRLKSGRKAWLRYYHLFKIGLTVGHLKRKGIRAKDLRLVQRRGWVQLST